jgi:hypothetical protein
MVTFTYKWHELYQTAVLETDWSKIEEHIRAAETALRQRKHEVGRDHGDTPEENQAIADAMKGLMVLRKDVTKWLERQEPTKTAPSGGPIS